VTASVEADDVSAARPTGPKESPAEAAVVGAGPYGLAVAAHLRQVGVEAQVFGETMAFWRRNMPGGMLLRSGWDASHVADPAGELTLDAYAAARGRKVERPIPLEDFIDYGEWYRTQSRLEVDPRLVRRIAMAEDLFHVGLEDGATVEARSVIVASGLERFDFRPPQFAELPAERVSHSSGHSSLAGFAGRRVTVVGGGQSAAESAALLHEAGADVELVLRKPRLNWLAGGRLATRPRLHRVLYPPADVGPPGLNWIVATPEVFRALPRGFRSAVSERVLRPAASDWLEPRLRDVPLRMDRTVIVARETGGGCTLTLDDGTTRTVDHVLLATGFRVDLARLPFLDELMRGLRLVDGSPLLRRGFESSIPGLHFVGAAATHSFGPLMRFVAGTGYAARSVTRRVRERLAVPMGA
jgi:lysine/ornithine N-monooxygenase